MIAKRFGPDVAARVGRFIAQRYLADHPVVAVFIDRGCRSLIDWLIGKWRKRHVQLALSELREQSVALTRAFAERWNILRDCALSHPREHDQRLRKAYALAEPWHERTFRPSLGAKFLAMAITRNKREMKCVESYYHGLFDKCSMPRKASGGDSDAVAKACDLYAQGAAVLLGDEPLLLVRESFKRSLARVNAELARLGEPELLRA